MSEANGSNAKLDRILAGFSMSPKGSGTFEISALATRRLAEMFLTPLIGQQLPLQIDGNEAWAGVDVLVARHAWLQKQNPLEP